MSDDLDEFIAEQSQDPRFRAAFADAGERSGLRLALAGYRRGAGLTVEDVAGRMGVRVVDVRAYERGETDPCLSFHQRYARAVGVRVSVEVEALEGVER